MEYVLSIIIVVGIVCIFSEWKAIISLLLLVVCSFILAYSMKYFYLTIPLIILYIAIVEHFDIKFNFWDDKD